MKNLTLVCFLFLLCLSVDGQLAQSDTNQQSTRYVIVFSEVEKHDKGMRSITVLIKPESFTESNLSDLIQRIGKRFPQPGLAYFDFYTDIDDIETPEERDGPGTSQTPELAAKQKSRAKRNEAFCIRLQSGKYGNCYMTFADGSKLDINIR